MTLSILSSIAMLIWLALFFFCLLNNPTSKIRKIYNRFLCKRRGHDVTPDTMIEAYAEQPASIAMPFGVVVEARLVTGKYRCARCGTVMLCHVVHPPENPFEFCNS